MPTHSNMDTALHTLAQEINDLHVSDASAHKSAQVEMGRKLIAVRVLLREKHGEHKSSPKDATGNRAPNGWRKWVVDNLSIKCAHATVCMKYALDPAGSIENERRLSQRKKNNSPGYALNAVKRCWPGVSTEQRSQIRQLVIELSKEAY